jgi:tetraacyldisaccharide 4'-kinase
MKRLLLKEKLEAYLLKVWYKNKKPSTFQLLCLNGLEILYIVLDQLIGFQYKARQNKGLTSPPLLVVGNLIAGGTGKTPIVMAVCLHMRNQGKKVGIISRGYGRKNTKPILLDPNQPLPKTSEAGDEPLFLCQETLCPVAVGANRNAALDLLLKHFPKLDLIVSDDGLQHHKLKRQLEWVVFDSRGQGNGRRLPAGPLRASLNQLKKVDAILASNISISDLSVLLNLPADERWHEISVELSGFKHLQTGRIINVNEARAAWNSSQVIAFTGIANPDKFFSALQKLGITPDKEIDLPDHFNYPDDFCTQFNQAILITSGKDAVKLDALNDKVWVAEISVKLPTALTKSLEICIGPTIN